MERVTNKFNVDLSIGDKLLITSDKLGNKMLANVEKDEIITITGFSDDGKIIYHNNSLALPVNSSVYRKLLSGEIGYLSYNLANTPSRLEGGDKEIEK